MSSEESTAQLPPMESATGPAVEAPVEPAITHAGDASVEPATEPSVDEGIEKLFQNPEPVLRDSEEPDGMSNKSGSSEFLNTGLGSVEIVSEPATEAPAEPAIKPAVDAAIEPPAEAEIDLRTRLIGQFTQWLDEMLADEPPPRGVPRQLLDQAISEIQGDSQPSAPDLFTLFSGLTKLSGEIGLQGRAFKQLSDLLAPLADAPAMLGRLAEAQEAAATILKDVAEAQAAQAEVPDEAAVPFDQVCGIMIDLYDRLQRGLQTCEEGIQSMRANEEKGGLRRLLGGGHSASQAIASVQALRDAGAMNLARVSAALQDWSVQRIGRTGEPFDPARMSAVDVRIDPQQPPGTVLVVNRSGYAINGNLKATAQVTVSKTA